MSYRNPAVVLLLGIMTLTLLGCGLMNPVDWDGTLIMMEDHIEPGESHVAVIYGGGGAHRWTFDGEAGQQVQVDVVATNPNGDPYFSLMDPNGDETAYSDDVDGSLNASVTVTLEHTGMYTIRIQGYSHVAYEITLTELAPISD